MITLSELSKKLAQEFIDQERGRFMHLYDRTELTGIPDNMRLKVTVEWVEPVEWTSDAHWVIPHYDEQPVK